MRNTDPALPIWVMSTQYSRTEGKRLRQYVPPPRVIVPLGTLKLFVPRSDEAGGCGANFLIIWKMPKPSSPSIVEGFHTAVSIAR